MRSTGGQEPVRHRDRELTGWVALRRRPNAGWSWGVLLARMDREAGLLAPWLTGLNERLVTEWGHRFPSGFEVTAGLRWDLDHFRRQAFDGGHVRFSSRW